MSVRSLAGETALLAAVALMSAGCADSAQQDTAVTSAPADTLTGPPVGSPVSTVAHGTRSSEPLNVRRVVVESWEDRVTITFVMYSATDPTLLQAPWCGSLAVTFLRQRRTVGSPSRITTPDPGSSVVVEASAVSPRILRMTLPRSVLGHAFSATEPWRAAAIGPACPPFNVNIEQLPTVRPRAP